MEDVTCVEERQEDHWCDSSACSLKSSCWEFNDSMLKDHRFPSIPNENHHFTTSGSNAKTEASCLDLCLGSCLVFNITVNHLLKLSWVLHSCNIKMFFWIS